MKITWYSNFEVIAIKAHEKNYCCSEYPFLLKEKGGGGQYQNVIWSLLNGKNNKKWGRISNIHLLQNTSPELSHVNVCHKFYTYIHTHNITYIYT
jgi:hypothetical protein